jgi:N-acetyl-alpha-D-muramate 1-phosphate uridylyltransferase
LRLPVLILAGGLSTRISNLTQEVPKSLLKFGGKPFLQWQLELLLKNDVKEVVLCVSHKSKMIEDFIKSTTLKNIEINFSYDGKEQAGTGGAIINALPLVGERFSVLYGDSYLPINFGKIEDHFISENCFALMTVVKNTSKNELSNVNFQDGQVREYNKSIFTQDMEYIDFGLNFFAAKAFSAYLNREYVDLPEIQYGLAIENKLSGFEVKSRYYEVGSVEGITAFEKFVREEL